MTHINRSLSVDTVKSNILDFKYEIRGKILEVAERIQSSIDNNSSHEYSFNKLLPANIGNPQAVGQKPITYYRQLISSMMYPELIKMHKQFLTTDKSNESDPLKKNSIIPFIPVDILNKAEYYLEHIKSVGAYSNSSGINIFKKEIALWFERRDGYKCDSSSIFLTDGASSAARIILELLCSNSNDGIMIPVPQYPFYKAMITRYGSQAIPYYLSEELQWTFTEDSLNESIEIAEHKGTNPKALVIINPGNPTGSLLTENNIVDILKFCKKKNLLLIADEVYQDNVFSSDTSFVSCRHVMKKYNLNIELVSLHSASKGYIGECGLRGGLMQLENIDPKILLLINKVMSVHLCSNVIGQIVMTAALTQHEPSDPSYSLYMEEISNAKSELKKKAKLIVQKLNTFEGVSCQPIMGAMYAFPQIKIPSKAIEAASHLGIQPDMLYCIELLESTGVICVPGSGFEQMPGTYHFRITILPSEDILTEKLDEMKRFHSKFLEKYK